MRCHYGSRQITTVLIVIAGLLTLSTGSGCGLHRAYCVSSGGCGSCDGCGTCGGEVMATDPCGCGGGCDGGACSGNLYPGTCGARSLGRAGGLSGFCLPLLSTRLACGSGCGGVYWNEWICDPPECCDPCSDGGCWVGPQPCGHPGGVLLGACRRVKRAVVGVIHLGVYGYQPGCYGGCVGGCVCGEVDECCDYGCCEVDGGCGCADCGAAGCCDAGCVDGCVDGCTGSCAGGYASSSANGPTLATRGTEDTRMAPLPESVMTPRKAGHARSPRRVATRQLRH